MCWCVRSIRMRRSMYTVWPALFPLVRYVKSLGVISPVKLLHSNLSTKHRKWDCFKSIFLLFSPCTSVFNLHDDWPVYIYVILCADRIVWWRCRVGWQQWQNSGNHQSARGKLQICGGQYVCVISSNDCFFLCVEHFIITFSYFLHYGLSNDISACVIMYRRMVVGRSLVYVSGLIVCTLFWKNAEEILHWRSPQNSRRNLTTSVAYSTSTCTHTKMLHTIHRNKKVFLQYLSD